MRASLRALIIGWLSAAMMLVGFPAHAGMIGTESLVAAESREANLAKVDAFMARDEVRGQLEGWGVDGTLAAERVAALSDAELQELALTIDSEPAGAGALAVVGIVFVVLLILELVGVTNIFTAI
ncbi:MAG: PA2779 family protein [Panacagrimonas sp.]